mgnify:CR=1 FL=1
MVEQSFYRLGIDGKDADLFGETACRAVEIRAAADVPMRSSASFKNSS